MILQWVAREKKETCESDFCSMVPDVLFGFPFYKACRLHDWLYEGRVPLSMSEPIPRWKADIIFHLYLIEIVLVTVVGHIRCDCLLPVFLRR